MSDEEELHLTPADVNATPHHIGVVGERGPELAPPPRPPDDLDPNRKLREAGFDLSCQRSNRLLFTLAVYCFGMIVGFLLGVMV